MARKATIDRAIEFLHPTMQLLEASYFVVWALIELSDWCRFRGPRRPIEV